MTQTASINAGAMAERTSTRNVNRRTTPQPIPRTSRTTRSQSRDVSESEIAKVGPKARKTTRQGQSKDEVNHARQDRRNERQATLDNDSRALQGR